MMESIIIDVRETEEFNSQRIEGAIHLPLSTFERQAPAILRTLDRNEIVFMCRSGQRAKLAAEKAAPFLPGDSRVTVFDGGMLEWVRQGRQVVGAGKMPFPMMRQVQIVAGSLALAGAALSWLVHPAFILLSGVVGAGLVFAGVTGFCGLASLLARMPWNRAKTTGASCSF
jgi:rhodanese-related sulfurtransferase